jgi:hypothetical protein
MKYLFASLLSLTCVAIPAIGAPSIESALLYLTPGSPQPRTGRCENGNDGAIRCSSEESIQTWVGIAEGWNATVRNGKITHIFLNYKFGKDLPGLINALSEKFGAPKHQPKNGVGGLTLEGWEWKTPTSIYMITQYGGIRPADGAALSGFTFSMSNSPEN